MRFLHLDYDSFDFAAGFVHVPANVLWYRAARPDVATLGDEPIYVGPKYVADFYASDPSRIYKTYRNPRQLRLLDIRFVQQLIPYILTHRRAGHVNSATMQWYKAACVTLGSCTLQRQIQLLQEIIASRHTVSQVITDGLARMQAFDEQADIHNTLNFVNPIEKQGVRVGITDMDYFVIGILRDVFNQVDGIIAPALFSPFHNQGRDNRMHPELVVFYPLQTLEEMPNTTTPSETVQLQTIVHQTSDFLFDIQIGLNYRLMNANANMRGGKESYTVVMWEDDREKILEQLRKGVKHVTKKYESAMRFAKSIDRDALPAFMSKYIRKPFAGEMRGIMDWNVAMATEWSQYCLAKT